MWAAPIPGANWHCTEISGKSYSQPTWTGPTANLAPQYTSPQSEPGLGQGGPGHRQSDWLHDLPSSSLNSLQSWPAICPDCFLLVLPAFPLGKGAKRKLKIRRREFCLWNPRITEMKVLALFDFEELLRAGFLEPDCLVPISTCHLLLTWQSLCLLGLN